MILNKINLNSIRPRGKSIKKCLESMQLNKFIAIGKLYKINFKNNKKILVHNLNIGSYYYWTDDTEEYYFKIIKRWEGGVSKVKFDSDLLLLQAKSIVNDSNG